jgi:hypothetical protein
MSIGLSASMAATMAPATSYNPITACLNVAPSSWTTRELNSLKTTMLVHPSQTRDRMLTNRQSQLQTDSYK